LRYLGGEFCLGYGGLRDTFNTIVRTVHCSLYNISANMGAGKGWPSWNPFSYVSREKIEHNGGRRVL
jgi:hypothetical protein